MEIKKQGNYSRKVRVRAISIDVLKKLTVGEIKKLTVEVLG